MTNKEKELFTQALNLITELDKDGTILEMGLILEMREALAQPEPDVTFIDEGNKQEPKLSDAGVDTNIPLWGLEPKGKGMVTLHQPEQEHKPWCDYLNVTLTSMPPQRAKCNCKIAQPEQEPVAWAVKRRVATCNEEYAKLWRSNGEEVIPLYTAPPKREWVGLSVNEARDFFESKLCREDLITEISGFLEEKNT